MVRDVAYLIWRVNTGHQHLTVDFGLLNSNWYLAAVIAVNSDNPELFHLSKVSSYFVASFASHLVRCAFVRIVGDAEGKGVIRVDALYFCWRRGR